MTDLNKDIDISNPWTRLTRQEIYANRWIRVTEDQVLTPARTPGIYGVVHMQSRAVGVIALNERGEIVLVGQYRYPIDQYSWEIPEGGAALSKSPLEEMQRELTEETGQSAEHWLELGQIHTSNSVVNETGIFYLAWGLRSGPAAPEDTEALAIRWLAWRDALDLALTGQLTDSITLAAILKLDALHRRGMLPDDILMLLDQGSLSTAAKA